MRLQRTVIGLDFSEASLEAARWTRSQFAPDADMILVHAMGRNGASDRERALKQLCAASAGLTPGPMAMEVVAGSPAVELARVAEERNADLIAVGKHGRGRAVTRVLGSTAERLVSESPVPVLLATGMGEGQPRNILVAVQDDSVKEYVIASASWLSEQFDAAAVALSVVGSEAHTHLISMAGLAARGRGVPGQELGEHAGDGAEEWVSEFVLADPAAQPPPSEAGSGDIADIIVQSAVRLKSDLIVVGSRRHGALRRAVLGSVARKVIRLAPCPVLVVKEPEDAIEAVPSVPG